MKINKLALAILMVLIATTGFAQKIKLTSGNLDFLKDQKTINVIYDYENMGVGKYENEQDYVSEKVSDYNAKEPGKGDEWHKNWVADRKARFEPRFEELMNAHLEKYDVQVGNYPDAEYTIVLKTVFTEPGFNVGVMRRPAFVNLQAVFVKTAALSDQLAVVTIDKAPGRDAMGFDFDSGYRIQESYAKAGKELAQYINKNVKK
ncbi:hypothetical protein [Cesiribacter sp. SM1]|uniref:hypothetical protein n=1 Tax=Cesiribacter sp. SM1 TaxID=2861196 RepID=UPI001CD490E0|nr:hypothetical protein [Cesiribacter sp. SM1]